VDGAKFDVLKLIELTPDWIGTVDDIREYFKDTEDDQSLYYNPYEA